MMNKTRILVGITLCLVGVLPLVGCDGNSGPENPTDDTKPPEKAIPKATTPRQLLVNMRQAAISGDSEAFLDCFDATNDKERRVLRASCEFGSALWKLDQAMIETYGQGLDRSGTGLAPSLDFMDEQWPEQAPLSVDAEEATIQINDESVDLVKKDGMWKIRIESIKGEQDIDKAANECRVMAQAVRDILPKVGQSGYTAERIEEELFDAMHEALGIDSP